MARKTNSYFGKGFLNFAYYKTGIVQNFKFRNVLKNIYFDVNGFLYVEDGQVK